MNSVKTIRAVERAFQVLRALESTPQGATLSELSAMTSLSGPTLLRLLKTLQAAHAVRRGLYDERWRNALGLGAYTRRLSTQERLADVAAPHLDALCAVVRWPSDLAVHLGDDDFMTVLESTWRCSPFYVRRSPGASRVNLLMSAVGTVFLAHVPAKQVRHLTQQAREGCDGHNTTAIATGDLSRRLSRARKLGYATRHPLYLGGPYNGPPRDDRVHALAVPIVHEGQARGAININWNRQAMSVEEMVDAHLARLVDTAAHIAEEAAAFGVFEPGPAQ